MGKSEKNCEGFSLIELIVAMFILALVMGGMIMVSVSVFRSYQKSKAVKTVLEEIGFAINSITKDVRMGGMEKSSTYANGGLESRLMVVRNRNQQKVCYALSSDYLKLSVFEGTTNCSNGTEKILVDLTGTGMVFDATSGFRSCPSAAVADIVQDPGYYACPSSAELRRGWAEINLNIGNPTMETDSIRTQTIVSSRDYGWEEAL